MYKVWTAGAILIIGAIGACRPPVGGGPVAAPEQGPSPAPEAPRPPRPGPGVATAALMPVGSGAAPRLAMALRGERESLLEALERSLDWFSRPSSRDYYPMGGVSHEQAWVGVAAFRTLVDGIEDPLELEAAILRNFDLFESIGSGGDGTVLFTGYYSPAFTASLRRSEDYRYPLYARPADLVIDRSTGEVRGRRVGERLVRFPSRAEIERSGMLDGLEIAWLRDRFDAYLIHVQGSAALHLPDGETVYVSYAGNNGHEYVSVARALVDDGELQPNELNLEEVRAWFRAHPDKADEYLRRNPRFVFFQLEEGTEWPVGSLGVRVTALRSIATDKGAFPPGGVTLVATRVADADGRFRPFEGFMLDQDSGGAIKSPGRADIYFGVGPEAETRAGAQYAEGRLFYLFLKPERLPLWRERNGPRR